MFYSLFVVIIPSVQYLGQQLSFKHKYHRVVPIHGHVYWNLKREVSWSDKEFNIAIIFRQRSREDSLLQAFYYLNAWNRLQGRKEWICESRCQVSDHLLFCVIFWLKPVPFHDYSLCSVCILHQACVLLSVCSLHFTLGLHFTPGPQSAVRSLPFTLFISVQRRLVSLESWFLA